MREAVFSYSMYYRVLHLYHKPSYSTVAPIFRFEISEIEVLESHEECKLMFDNIGWTPFLEHTSGFNIHATKDFAMSFNGETTRVGDVDLFLSEEFVAHATCLLVDDEMVQRSLDSKLGSETIFNSP